MTSALGLSAISETRWRPAMAALGRYLGDIGFHGLYKYLVSISCYHILPSLLSQKNAAYIRRLDGFVNGGPGWNLAKCLTVRRGCAMADLDAAERELADVLAAVGFVHIEADRVEPGSLQLASIAGNYLFLDAAAHFPLGRVHEVYIGVDTLLLVYYLKPRRTRGLRSLDICSGTGAIALASAFWYDDVTATDISPDVLALIRMNRFLNGLDDRMAVLDEELSLTLDSAERYDLVTCNPPYVAFPPGFARPLYAAGTGVDGLDYLRLLVERVPGMLRPDGEGLLVADLPGDADGPHFFRELAKYADSLKVGVDAYVDNRLDADVQAEAMAEFLSHLHPERSGTEIVEREREFIRRDLNASHYYLTTIRLRADAGRGLRVFNRHGAGRLRDDICAGNGTEIREGAK